MARRGRRRRLVVVMVAVGFTLACGSDLEEGEQRLLGSANGVDEDRPGQLPGSTVADEEGGPVRIGGLITTPDGEHLLTVHRTQVYAVDAVQGRVHALVDRTGVAWWWVAFLSDDRLLLASYEQNETTGDLGRTVALVYDMRTWRLLSFTTLQLALWDPRIDPAGEWMSGPPMGLTLPLVRVQPSGELELHAAASETQMHDAAHRWASDGTLMVLSEDENGQASLTAADPEAYLSGAPIERWSLSGFGDVARYGAVFDPHPDASRVLLGGTGILGPGARLLELDRRRPPRRAVRTMVSDVVPDPVDLSPTHWNADWLRSGGRALLFDRGRLRIVDEGGSVLRTHALVPGDPPAWMVGADEAWMIAWTGLGEDASTHFIDLESGEARLMDGRPSAGALVDMPAWGATFGLFESGPDGPGLYRIATDEAGAMQPLRAGEGATPRALAGLPASGHIAIDGPKNGQLLILDADGRVMDDIRVEP